MNSVSRVGAIENRHRTVGYAAFKDGGVVRPTEWIISSFSPIPFPLLCVNVNRISALVSPDSELLAKRRYTEISVFALPTEFQSITFKIRGALLQPPLKMNGSVSYIYTRQRLKLCTVFTKNDPMSQGLDVRCAPP